MTDTTQPGDGLPPSEPTQDIGAEPLNEEYANEWERHYVEVCIPADMARETYRQLDREDAMCERDDMPMVWRRNHLALQAERDALAAQLARVQGVIDALPTERPGWYDVRDDTLSRLPSASDLLIERQYARRMAEYEVRQQIEAALKGEAK